MADLKTLSKRVTLNTTSRRVVRRPFKTVSQNLSLNIILALGGKSFELDKFSRQIFELRSGDSSPMITYLVEPTSQKI